MSTEKKYQIFISSTYEDLKLARDEVIKAILSMYHIPIGMEMFSADDAEQWDTIKETIDNSDYYVLIIGHRYGSETKQGISYTEKEFDYARKKKIPVYTFVRNRNVATLPQERDTEPSKAVKLDAFIKKAQSPKMVDFWETPDDLGKKVSIAMTKAFTRRPRTGWVKSDQAASPDTLKELTTLSRENRELKDELSRLKAQKAATPSLQVTFNREENISINFSQDYDSSNLILPLTPEILNSQEEGVLSQLDSTLINPYNDWIESNIVIVAKLNHAIAQHEKAKSSIYKLMIGLKNSGSSKANDINVIVTFPPEFFVFDSKSKKRIPDLSFSENIPINPLSEATKDYKRLISLGKKVRDYSKPLFPELNIKSNHHFIEIQERTINFYCKDLLHTQSLRDDKDLNIYLMPTAIGSFIAKVEVICEEYSEPQFYEIPIVVQ